MCDLAAFSADSQEEIAIKLARQDDWRTTVRIDSPKSQDVHWSVRFAGAR